MYFNFFFYYMLIVYLEENFYLQKYYAYIKCKSNIDLRHCLNTQHGILSQTYRGGYNARSAITKVLPFVSMKPLLHGKASIMILVS